VRGESASSTGAGVYGKATANGGVGVRAQGNGIDASHVNTALSIENGAIRVPGAGVNTTTAVFVHENQGECSPGLKYFTCIDNPLTNGDPKAILIVTPVANGPWNARILNYSPICVTYADWAGKWVIENLDGSDMTVGARFNVMVIKTSSP